VLGQDFASAYADGGTLTYMVTAPDPFAAR
jgi:hypothetical protein